MGPTPETPRLLDIDPIKFATDIYRLVIDHRASEAKDRLAPGISARREAIDPKQMMKSALWLEAFRLASYAKTGLDSAENAARNWEDAIEKNREVLASAAQRYLGSVGGTLYSVAGPTDRPIEINVDTYGDPKTDFGVVLLATTARFNLYEARGRVSTRELAALASLNERRIRQVVAEGGLARSKDDPNAIDAKSALAWLKARGEKV